MAGADWGAVPGLLGEYAVLQNPRVVGAIDQKRAALRDWLDSRDLPVTDPDALRAVLAGAELLARDVGQACVNGTLPVGVSGLVASVFAGLVVTLGDYVPDEVRRG